MGPNGPMGHLVFLGLAHWLWPLGPYALWHHKHFINEVKGGIEMEDIIDYKVPLGWLGQLVHPILVKPKLDEIFEYRKRKLTELFGSI